MSPTKAMEAEAGPACLPLRPLRRRPAAPASPAPRAREGPTRSMSARPARTNPPPSTAPNTVYVQTASMDCITSEDLHPFLIDRTFLASPDQSRRKGACWALGVGRRASSRFRKSVHRHLILTDRVRVGAGHLSFRHGGEVA